MVPLSQLPTENEQSNFIHAGTPYFYYDSGIMFFLNDVWAWFVPEERLFLPEPISVPVPVPNAFPPLTADLLPQPDFQYSTQLNSPEPISAEILDKIYLGMTVAEVHDLFSEPDFHASGLMWFGYNDVGIFNPTVIGTNGIIDEISLTNGTKWSMYELINSAVIHHNRGKYQEPDGIYPTESHIILALDANPRGFTAYVISLFNNYLPDGEYNVRSVSGGMTPLALTFEKNQNGYYGLTEYWEADPGDKNMSSIRAKFPKEAADKLESQSYNESLIRQNYEQAMYFFVGAIPSYMGYRFGIGAGTAVVNKLAGSDVENGYFVVKYFPGATLEIEKYDEARSFYPLENWVVEYTDSRKNITVGGDGMNEIFITDDLIGIFNADTGEYAMKFEKYARV
jgi:hypothetical protein